MPRWSIGLGKRHLSLKALFGDSAEIVISSPPSGEVGAGRPNRSARLRYLARPARKTPPSLRSNGVVAVRGVVLGTEWRLLRFKFGEDIRKINLAKLVGVVFGGTESKR